LERAHRLAPHDGTITLMLASAALGDDNPRAAALFSEVLASNDVRDAWLGLATARFLILDMAGAREAVDETLRRHALWPDLARLAGMVAEEAGWCGLTGEGVVIVRTAGTERLEIAMDGKLLLPVRRQMRTSGSTEWLPLKRRGAVDPGHPVRLGGASGPPDEPGDDAFVPGDDALVPGRDAFAGDDGFVRGDEAFAGDDGFIVELNLPPGWPRAGSLTVMATGRHLMGSPISLSAIGRVEGQVEVSKDGVRGWAWCPGDPDTDPLLSVGIGRGRREIVASEPAGSVPGLAPLARPRSFAISWAESSHQPAGRGTRGLQFIASGLGSTRASRATTPVLSPSGMTAASADPRVKPEDDEVTSDEGDEVTSHGGDETTRHGGDEIARHGGDETASRHHGQLVSDERSPVRVRGRDGRELQKSPRAKQPRAPAIVAPARRDLARWRGNTMESVILITHDDGGGVERRIQASIAAHEAMGHRAIVLRPTKPGNGPAGVTVSSRSLPDLRFELPGEQPALLRLFRRMRPVEAELHHFLNHDPSAFETIRVLGLPYDAHTHDYTWFCPRIALVGRNDRYCGEPAPAGCEICVAETSSFLHEDISVPALLGRSQDILSGARRVIAPSHDAAARMARHFHEISPIVIPHEDDAAVDEPPPIPRVEGAVLVCVAGAIGLHKGFHVLLACARDAKKRGLDLSFVVAGTTIDDQRLIDTERVFVTGPYQPDEAVALIKAQRAALALLPSIWPETWCLGLTELWRAGLRVAAFDIGAPAERIRQTGRGFLLPLGLSPRAINDALLNASRGRSLLPIRRSSAYKQSINATMSK
jgi:glycosyltransferase involved in cell wall biosynthesis